MIPPNRGLVDLIPFTRIGLLTLAPKDWQISLAFAAKYYGWSRDDAMGCTIPELRWWFARIAELEEKK
jgi:hypothetical protein